MKNLINKKNEIDGLSLLSKVTNSSVKCAFFDPQYRGILDKMSYGNEGARQIERVALHQMTEETIKDFIKEISNKLLPSGYLFLWIDKFHLCEGFKHWLPEEMKIVDMMTWNKGKIGMGYRTRRKSEYMAIIQKLPIKAKATWKLHNIPDVWDEKLGPKIHPHQKPFYMQETLILATTEKDDLILDPCAGSFTIFDICQKQSRNFIGTDLKIKDK